MARYTDIDLLIEAVEETDWYHISKHGELSRGANSKDDIPLYKHSDIIAVLNNAPIADVVPKSEVEDYKHNWQKIHDSYNADCLEHYNKGRQDAAREIFEEIENRAYGFGACFVEMTRTTFDELKKKYTEE